MLVSATTENGGQPLRPQLAMGRRQSRCHQSFLQRLPIETIGDRHDTVQKVCEVFNGVHDATGVRLVVEVAMCLQQTTQQLRAHVRERPLSAQRRHRDASDKHFSKHLRKNDINGTLNTSLVRAAAVSVTSCDKRYGCQAHMFTASLDVEWSWRPFLDALFEQMPRTRRSQHQVRITVTLNCDLKYEPYEKCKRRPARYLNRNTILRKESRKIHIRRGHVRELTKILSSQCLQTASVAFLTCACSKTSKTHERVMTDMILLPFIIQHGPTTRSKFLS